jgi:hypothetical protein
MLDKTDLENVSHVFRVYEVRDSGPFTYLFGELLVEPHVFYGELYKYFAGKGKSVQVEYRLGEYVAVIGPMKKEAVWINAVLLLATLLTTMVTGAMLYGVDPFTHPLDVWQGLPFSLAIMLVLGSHELGHYIVSKRHGIDASLP